MENKFAMSEEVKQVIALLQQQKEQCQFSYDAKTKTLIADAERDNQDFGKKEQVNKDGIK